jgi:hypothetical protein
VALLVLISGLGVVAAPVSAADTYADGDQSIAVVVDWDDTAVSDGDTATLIVIDSTTSETVDLTVRDASGTETTYWIDYDDLADVSPADAETVDVTSTNATISVFESVAYDGDRTIGISDGEGIETSLDVDSNYSSLPVDVDLKVIDEDGTTVLNETTVGSLNGSETAYNDFHPSLSTNTSNVTVQVDYVTNGTHPQFDAVDSYDANRITVGIFGGGSGGNSMLIIGIVVLLGAVVLLRD